MKINVRVKVTNLELARREALAQIPEGYHVVSEEIRHEGVKQHTRVSALSLKEALKKIEPGKVVIETKVVTEPEMGTEQFMAKDDDHARAISAVMAQEIMGELGLVHSIKRLDSAKKGLVTSSKNRYEVVIARRGVYDLKYVKAAVLELTASNREFEPDFEKLRSDHDVKTLSALLSDPEFEIRSEAFRSLNSFLSSRWARPEEKEAIRLVLNKAAPDFGDEFLLSIIQEDWNKWIAVNYLAESDDPSTLATLLREVDDISSYSEVICKLIDRFGTGTLDQPTLHHLVETLTTTALHVGSMPHEALGSTRILIALNEPGLLQTLEKILHKQDYQYSHDGGELNYSYEEQRKLARAELKKRLPGSTTAASSKQPFQE